MSKTIEVDETQFMANQELAKTVAAMLKNPDSRNLVLKAQKIVNPSAVIPEIDAAAPVQKALDDARKEFTDGLAAINKEREEEKAARKREALVARFEEGRKSLRSEGYNDDGIAEVEKLMEAKGIIDHEDGKTLFEKLHPPQEPVKSTGFGSWNFLDEAKGDDADKNMKLLMESKGESEAALNGMINSALTEARGARR